MAKYRFHVKLPNGEKVWLTGNTISEAFCSGFEKFAMPEPPPKKGKCPTLRSYGEKWFRLYHQPKVKRNTANNTRILLEKHLFPALGSRRMDELTFDDIQAFYNSKAMLSRSTNQKLQIALGAIFRNALEDGLIEKNIMLSSRYVMSKHRSIRNCLTQQDAEHILMQVEQLNASDQPFIMLPLLTGMRRGECLGLMWSDIDFTKRMITVSRAITFTGNQPVVDTPKSAAGYRQIPLLPELQAFLLSMPQRTGFVIGGQQPITEQTYQRTWERISRTIDLHGATAHVFRHTFATLAAVHTDVKNLQAIMGHSDIQTTMNRYTHPQELRVMAAVEDLAGMFDTRKLNGD